MTVYTLPLALGEEKELVGRKRYLVLQQDRGLEKILPFAKDERYTKYLWVSML